MWHVRALTVLYRLILVVEMTWCNSACRLCSTVWLVYIGQCYIHVTISTKQNSWNTALTTLYVPHCLSVFLSTSVYEDRTNDMLHMVLLPCISIHCLFVLWPDVGSEVLRIDPLCFLAGYHKRWLNQCFVALCPLIYWSRYFASWWKNILVV